MNPPDGEMNGGIGCCQGCAYCDAATLVGDVMTPHPQTVPPDMKVSEAVLIMIERGFRHLPIVSPADKILGVFSVRDALPREIGDAVSLAEFNDQVNDALG